MEYEQTKRLSNREFKRLVGVQRRTFDEIVHVLRDAATKRLFTLLSAISHL
ncbi:hypothetical protein [Anabaena sp. PCC 7108]|uniref:hypothetical protein n=1 Tax=Anabaena sp. PCC 7108 TaxID=163908 RepID=UPI00034AB030|nr:hypothetical protein [Anabaena sp. PCC 7108]